MLFFWPPVRLQLPALRAVCVTLRLSKAAFRRLSSLSVPCSVLLQWVSLLWGSAVQVAGGGQRRALQNIQDKAPFDEYKSEGDISVYCNIFVTHVRC